MEVQRQIGNAVPSLLAEVLGRAIREQLLDRPGKGSFKLLLPKRSATPLPEKVSAVPKHYLALLGEHEAHPGTGKGFGAVRREESGEAKAAQAPRVVVQETFSFAAR